MFNFEIRQLLWTARMKQVLFSQRNTQPAYRICRSFIIPYISGIHRYVRSHLTWFVPAPCACVSLTSCVYQDCVCCDPDAIPCNLRRKRVLLLIWPFPGPICSPYDIWNSTMNQLRHFEDGSWANIRLQKPWLGLSSDTNSIGEDSLPPASLHHLQKWDLQSLGSSIFWHLKPHVKTMQYCILWSMYGISTLQTFTMKYHQLCLYSKSFR